MSAPTCTDAELLELVKHSGYPFELTVAEALLANGFQVQLSQHFYNPLKQKDSELDILATKTTVASLKSIPQLNLHLELAIECKKNALPFVLFGFPSPPRPPADLMDADCRYIKTRSTEDKFPNKLAMAAFGDIREEKPRDIKPLLHQFNSPIRFHHVTQVETEGGKIKLHESEKLRSTLGGLVGYSDYMQDLWMKSKSVLERMAHDPTLWITFYLVVHNGKHFRYTSKEKLQASTHTTLFTSFHSDSNSLPIAIDFVQFNELTTAIMTISESFRHLADHLGRYLSPTRKSS